MISTAQKNFDPRGTCARRVHQNLSRDRNIRLLQYQKTIRDLDLQLFDATGHLGTAFLSRFSAVDMHNLARAFKLDQDAPGLGSNIWPLWITRYPNHTEVEWATFWHFWLHSFLTKNQINVDRSLIDVPTVLPESFLFTFNMAEVQAMVAASDIQGLCDPDSFFRDNPTHTQADWLKLWESWLGPIIISVTRNTQRQRPAGGVPFSEFTALAQKYGPSQHFFFQQSEHTPTFPRRSGYTPRHKPLGHSPLTPMAQTREEEYESYQHDHLGMTLEGLYDLEIVAKPNLKPQGLTNAIHPAMDRPRWRMLATDSRSPDGRFWDLENYDDMWDAISPCLRLATRLMTDSHLETWWDDLLHAQDKCTFYQEKPWWRFYRRNTEVKQRQRLNWELVSTNLFFKIRHLDEDLANTSICDKDGVDRTQEFGEGSKLPPEDRYAVININSKEMIILMATGPKKLSVAERLVYTFYVAVTIVHELAHAYGQIFHGTFHGQLWTDPDTQVTRLIQKTEPFYDDEDFAELGYSMEIAIFGGVTRPWVEDPREQDLKRFPPAKPGFDDRIITVDNLPALHLWTSVSPNFRDIDTIFHEDNLVPIINRDQWKDGPQFNDFNFIPLAYIEEIQQDSFWEVYVREYGGGMLKPYPQILTGRFTNDSTFQPENEELGRRNNFFGSLDYKILQWQKLGLDAAPRQKYDDLSQPYIDRRTRNAEAVALQVELRRQEKLRQTHLRKLTTTPHKQAQITSYLDRRKQEEIDFNTAREAAWREQDVQELAENDITQSEDWDELSLDEKMGRCREEIRLALDELRSLDTPDDFKGAWQKAWVNLSRVEVDLTAEWMRTKNVIRNGP